MASAGSSIAGAAQAVLPALQRSENPPLHFASFMGDVTRVKERLLAGDDVDALCHVDVDSNVSVLTPIFCAAAKGHGKVVKVLLKAGANPSAVDPREGSSVLHVAAEEGYVEIIAMLTKAGATVDCTDLDGKTALFCAARAGHAKGVEALLSASAMVDIANKEGETPLMTAAGHGHDECVRLLLRAGADLLKVMMVANNGLTALHFGAGGGSVVVVRTLLSWGAEVNTIGKTAGEDGGVSALQIAAQFGNVGVIKVLIDAGVDMLWTDPWGSTAVHYAAQSGHCHAVEALISARAPRKRTAAMSAPLLASVDARDSQGRTAIFAAARGGHSRTVKLLLDAGSYPHLRDQDNATILMFAKDLPTVKVLLEAGVSATTVDIDGDTALHRVGMRGCSAAVICAVFKAGANPTLLNKAGQTAAQLARENGHNDAATLLDMLATKYTQSEKRVLEVKDGTLKAAPSEEVSELEGKTSACYISNTNDEVDVELAESGQAVEKKRQHRSVRPCLNCQTLTHRRCARCRTAYMCSHDCQVATLAEHRVECMEIYEIRNRAKAEPEVEGKQEESD